MSTQEEFSGPFVGTSPGDTGSFADAARNAEKDLMSKHDRAPDPPITFKANCFVTIGNPIHEFIVELTPRP
jgi:hypothetical protein